jgi:hypothetical protein
MEIVATVFIVVLIIVYMFSDDNEAHGGPLG